MTATVTDSRGRFVTGLTRDDFTVYENGSRQHISHFSSERGPISLGILLDASGSMSSDRMASARAAVDRLLALLGDADELFFGAFASTARITQGWTGDRQAIRRAAVHIRAAGGTALYDAVAEALPLAERGRHTKKAILIISDGVDTESRTGIGTIRAMVRQSEVLVYALGVDATTREAGSTSVRPPAPAPIPTPFPRPGGRRWPQITLPPVFGGGMRAGERVDAGALRQITDDSGGRTEIVRGFDNLDAATARIADELSRQYSLGYSSTEAKDGRWHEIRVEVRDRRLTVRARRGYVAS